MTKATSNGVLQHGLKNFIIGVDGCICKFNKDSECPPERASVADVLGAVEIEGAREWVNDLAQQGHYVCFFTQRPEKLRKATVSWLEKHGFRFHSLVMEKPDAMKYHYIDDRHVQATTFKGRYSKLVQKEHKIEVFG